MANNTRTAHILISEGDTCYRNQLYEKAIIAYTKALDLDKDREVLLQRSRCYVQLGLSDEAIEDATLAIDEDNSFYRGFYQKGEAYYSAGEFEEALVFYYRAYRRRPDIEEFRLGVQKAEESILRALAACAEEEKLVEFTGRTNITTKQFVENLEKDKWPENYNENDAHRCLCGCPWCNCELCSDLYVERERCACRCEACLRHCALRHAVLPVPQSETFEVETVGDLLGDAKSVSATATPATPALMAMIGDEQATKKEYPDSSARAARKKNSSQLERDKEFLLALEQDNVFNQNERIDGILTSGITFINKRSEFWRSEGSDAKSRTSDLRKPPTHLQSIGVRVNAVDFKQIVSKLQACQECIVQKRYEEGEQLIGELKQLVQNIIVKNNDKDLENEEAKIKSDVFAMSGCLKYEQLLLEPAAEEFTHSFECCAGMDDNWLRGVRNALRCYFKLKSHEKVVEMFLLEQEHIGHLPRRLQMLDAYRALLSCELTQTGGEQLLISAFACLDALAGQPFDLARDFAVKPWVGEEEAAPTWFTEEDRIDENEQFVALICLQAIGAEYDKQFQRPRAKLAWKQVEKLAGAAGNTAAQSEAIEKQRDEQEEDADEAAEQPAGEAAVEAAPDLQKQPSLKNELSEKMKADFD